MVSDGVVEALLALSAGERDRAVRAVRGAAGGPGAGLLAPALARHLAGGGADVYGAGAAFERFADGGGNVALYRAAHAALAAAHGRARPRTVVDLGCGDGRLAAAALRPGLERVDLVEPSAELLAAATVRLAGAGAEVVAHRTTAQSFVADDGRGTGGRRWDVGQSTFALHTLEPGERAQVLRALAGTVGRLLVVEFDVPAFADRSPEHARHAAERYEAGVAEYRHDDVVVDGFLMPVLAGQFDPDRPRLTWEQPIDAWAADLAAAGFAAVDRRPVADYWWAPAELVEATA